MSARHDDLKMDWRSAHPGHAKPMAARRKPTMRDRAGAAILKLFEAFRAIPGGEPSYWRDVAIFVIGGVWGGIIVFGVLLAMAARHAS